MTDFRIHLLKDSIHKVLRDNPAGVSEYDLIESLSEGNDSTIDRNVFDSDLSLFQNHFLVFHCLYLLRDELRARSEADLEIHCLNIKLISVPERDRQMLDHPDPLRAYYLDLNNLETTTEQDVGKLLDSFWQRYISADYATSNHDSALEILGLKAPVTYEEIKTAYRRLVMEHHPDRGGDTARLQLINEAMVQLKAYYGH